MLIDVLLFFQLSSFPVDNSESLAQVTRETFSFGAFQWLSKQLNGRGELCQRPRGKLGIIFLSVYVQALAETLAMVAEKHGQFFEFAHSLRVITLGEKGGSRGNIKQALAEMLKQALGRNFVHDRVPSVCIHVDIALNLSGSFPREVLEYPTSIGKWGALHRASEADNVADGRKFSLHDFVVVLWQGCRGLFSSYLDPSYAPPSPRNKIIQEHLDGAESDEEESWQWIPGKSKYGLRGVLQQYQQCHHTSGAYVMQSTLGLAMEFASNMFLKDSDRLQPMPSSRLPPPIKSIASALTDSAKIVPQVTPQDF